tara:strand:- start:2209 stop:3366 length:1158 start_codon:yes stop_codon:yes gene_type:complete
MSKKALKALLPAGLEDLLPPEADQEDAMVRLLSDNFTSYGYQRVKPPLLEFEDSLLDGIGEAVAGQTFRLMDPISQRMMGLRADITPQVARLAATRLQDAPRPLRLMYVGEVFRVKGEQLRTNRAISTIGVELIGAARAAKADAEVILLAAESVIALGVDSLSVDINVPPLARMICDHFDVSVKTCEELLNALNRKDANTIEKVSGQAAVFLLGLLDAAGPANVSLTKLEQLELPGESGLLGKRLKEVVGLILEEAPNLNVTVDPADSRGFEYHTGISFALFARNTRVELGIGGRYLTAGDEPATGFTLSTDIVMEAAALPPLAKRLYVPFGTVSKTRKQLQGSGWVTVNGLIPEKDLLAEGVRMQCSHVWLENKIQRLDVNLTR